MSRKQGLRVWAHVCVHVPQMMTGGAKTPPEMTRYWRGSEDRELLRMKWSVVACKVNFSLRLSAFGGELHGSVMLWL